MSVSRRDQARVLALAEQHCANDLSEAEVAELEGLLRDNPEACSIFGNYVQLHANLEERLLAEAAGAERFVAPTAAGIIRRQFNRTLHFFTRPTPFSMSVAALVIGLLITAMAFVAPPFYRALRRPAGDLAEQQSRVVAQLTRLHNTQWAKGQPPLARGAQLEVGRQLSLASGLVELTYENGARLIVEGPAVLRITGRNAAHLEHGRTVARVGDESTGFCLATELLRVVDLGTEFGVVLHEQGNGEVVVFQGEVEVQTNQSNARHRRLFAGEQLHFDAAGKFIDGVLLASGSDSDKLVRIMPGRGGIDDDATYEEIIAAIAPVAWYRMERDNGGQIVDASGHGNHGRIIATSTVDHDFWQPGFAGDSLSLRGPSFGDYAIVSSYPQAKRGQLTVAAWVYAERKPAWASVAKNWGEGALGQFHFGLTADGNNLSIYVQDAEAHTISAIDPEPFPVGEWQHVAFVCTGKYVRLYRNGNLVADESCDGLCFPVASTALGIGAKLGESGTTASGSAAGFWHGRLDEIVIANAAVAQGALERCMAASQKPLQTNPQP